MGQKLLLDTKKRENKYRKRLFFLCLLAFSDVSSLSILVTLIIALPAYQLSR